MEIIIVMLFLILLICTPITAAIYFLKKSRGRDVSQQIKYLKSQGIAWLITLLFIVIFSNKSNQQETNETQVVEPSVCLETEEEYKKSCQNYSYKDVLRNPEDYVGKRVKINLKINSVHEQNWINSTKYYLAYSEGEYGWYGNLYGIFDLRQDDSFKILSNDIITIYGEIASPEYTSSLVLSSQEIFCIEMKYMEFISE